MLQMAIHQEGSCHDICCLDDHLGHRVLYAEEDYGVECSFCGDGGRSFSAVTRDFG